MFPDKLLANTPNKNMPKFKVTGQIESDICNFVDDIRGFFNVEVNSLFNIKIYLFF